MEKDDQNLNTGAESEENFEELLNQSLVGPIRLSPGERIEAVITTITKEYAFIDLGGKSEGYISLDEFLDEEGDVTLKEGDIITAYFISSKNNEMLFTTRLSGDKSGGGEHLEEAYHNQIPIEGFVEKEIKGGFEIKIGGNIRAFCPYSQMALHRVTKADEAIGQHLTFKIIEYGEKGRNIIVSHRIILEEELQTQKEALMETLKEGMTVSGKITSIKEFGAFVDIGGIEGLIPVSEISWGRVGDVNSVVSTGQQVDVAIKTLDWKNNKFSFSLKEILPDPWSDVELKYPEGSTHTGTVARLARFGAFITLEPGIDGLIHISDLGKVKRINHPREILEEAQAIKVKIGKTNKSERRLSLSLVSDDQVSDDMDYYKKHVADTKRSTGSFSTLGDILKAKLDNKKD